MELPNFISFSRQPHYNNVERTREHKWLVQRIEGVDVYSLAYRLINSGVGKSIDEVYSKWCKIPNIQERKDIFFFYFAKRPIYGYFYEKDGIICKAPTIKYSKRKTTLEERNRTKRHYKAILKARNSFDYHFSHTPYSSPIVSNVYKQAIQNVAERKNTYIRTWLKPKIVWTNTNESIHMYNQTVLLEHLTLSVEKPKAKWEKEMFWKKRRKYKKSKWYINFKK